MSDEIPLRSFARLALVAASVGAGVALVGLLLWGLAEVWLLIFAGVLLAVSLHAVVTWFMSLGLPHGMAYAVTLFLFLTLFVVFLLFFLPLIGEGLDALTHDLPETINRIADRLSAYGWGKDLIGLLQEADWTRFTAGTLSRLAGFFSTALGALAALFMVTITGLYFAADPRIYRKGMLALVPPRARPRASEIMEMMRRTLGWWIVGRLASMLIVGLLIGMTLALLKLPFAATLALLAALLSFIPNFGPIIAAVPAVLIGTAASPLTGLYVMIAYIVVEVVETYFITPLIVRKTVDLPPATVLIMQIAFGALYGFLGLLLATPLTVILMILVKTIYIEEIMGERSAT